MEKYMKKVAYSLLVLSFLIPAVAHAATDITYKGYGIWSWSSVSDWSVSSTKKYKVTHKQTRTTATSSISMTVYITKKEFVGSSTAASSSFKGSTNGSFSVNLDKGTYYLRFEAPKALKFDISGSVTH